MRTLKRPTSGMDTWSLTLERPGARAEDEGMRKTRITRSCRHRQDSPRGEHRVGKKGWDQAAGMATSKRWTKGGAGGTV